MHANYNNKLYKYQKLLLLLLPISLIFSIFIADLIVVILCIFFLYTVISKKKFHKKKIIHVCSKKRLSTYQIIKLAVKEKKMRQNIIPVSESFFKSKFVKPKKLGLKSIYKECNRYFIYEWNL